MAAATATTSTVFSSLSSYLKTVQIYEKKSITKWTVFGIVGLG